MSDEYDGGNYYDDTYYEEPVDYGDEGGQVRWLTDESGSQIVDALNLPIAVDADGTPWSYNAATEEWLELQLPDEAPDPGVVSTEAMAEAVQGVLQNNPEVGAAMESKRTAAWEADLRARDAVGYDSFDAAFEAHSEEQELKLQRDHNKPPDTVGN